MTAFIILRYGFSVPTIGPLRIPNSYSRGDNNSYYAGRIAGHAVVLLQLPNMGPLAAASGAAGLRSSYLNIQLALLVGVCGGLPVINGQSAYLGDVVVSKSVVNYDFGRQYPDKFVPKDGVDDSLGRANKDIRGLLAWLERERGMKLLLSKTADNLAILQKRAQEEYGSKKYSPLPDWDDRIFPSDYQHKHPSGECNTCEQGHFCQAAAKLSCTEIGDGSTNGIPTQNHGIAVNGTVNHGNVVSGTLVTGNHNTGTIVHGNYYRGSNDASKSDGPRWLVPRAVNPLFTGRFTILETIERAIEQEIPGCHKVFALTGLGGQGKSEVCLQVANRVRQRFWGVFWVDVGTLESAKSSFSQVSSHLGMPASAGEDPVEKALHLLANIRPGRRWLLILDNADEEKTDYHRYIPSGSQGAILVTSRLRDCQDLSTAGYHELQDLDEADCVELLLNAAHIQPSTDGGGEEDVQAAKRVIQLLGSHTLALVHAGAYIRKGLCTLSGYPAVYQAQQQRLLNFSPSQSQSRYRSVHATFEASAQVLETSSEVEAQVALELLAVLSVLHSRDVPLDVFQDAWRGARVAKTTPSTENFLLGKLTLWHVQRLPGFLRSDDPWNHDLVFSGGIARLRSLAFITTGTVRGVLTASMHPLVHEWLLLRQTEASRRGWRLAGTCILMLSDFGVDWIWQPYRPLLMSHSKCLIQHEKWLSSMQCPSRQELQLLVLASQHLYRDRLYDDAVRILRWVFWLLGGEDKALSLDNLFLFVLMGTIQLELPRPNEAIRYFQYALRFSKKNLPRDSDTHLFIMRWMATAYKQEDQQHEMLALLEEVLEVAKTELNNDGSVDIATLRDIGTIHFEAGNTERAISIFERVVEYQASVRSKFDPDFLMDQTILGDAYYEDGQPEKAIEILEKVALIRKSTSPPSNPDRLNLEHNLALAYGGARRPKEAICLLRHVVGVQATIYPKTHPAAILSKKMLNLALEMGKYLPCSNLLQPLHAPLLTDS
ncbi:hypothetical protein PspLS_04347 [Pyricularia sp. CBS 133598]|nr:hypothetical protein PspLS_04347 [Pyricularia sp. CBS 133598]